MTGSTIVRDPEGKARASMAMASVQKGLGEFALVADIGGTNARFALAPIGGPSAPVEPRHWCVADFPSLAEAASAYLAEAAAGVPVRAGMIAVAGPANRDEVKITNCSWTFSIEATRRALGFDRFYVINDFAANSWGIFGLGPDKLTSLGGPAPGAGLAGAYAVVGPGTGLGVSAIHADRQEATVLSSEGGHADFAPVSDEEIRILQWLRERHHRVSYERLICGPGLRNIYHAIGGDAGLSTPEEITARKAEDEKAAQAVRIFCEVLGSFAGNAALMFGAWQGVFLAGGMLRPIREELLSGGFRRRFEDKGRFGAELRNVPTLLVEEPALGLLGAATALRYRLRAG